MHFSKTYTELLLSLPPELRNSAIEYRKLKKLINQVVRELTQLGLSPDVLQRVQLESRNSDPKGKGRAEAGTQPESEKEVGIEELSPWRPIATSQDAATGLPRVVYEINTDSDCLEPRLRVSIRSSSKGSSSSFPLPLLANLEQVSQSPISSLNPAPREEHDQVVVRKNELERAAAEIADTSSEAALGPMPGFIRDSGNDSADHEAGPSMSGVRETVIPISTSLLHSPSSLDQEVIIPLPSDTIFFQVLMQALQALSTQLGAVADEFIENLHDLARAISATARPISATSHSFTALSNQTHPAMVRVGPPRLLPIVGRNGKSDLYQWREVLQMYVDMEVFESQNERTRGERTVEDSEERLEKFRTLLQERGYLGGRAMRMKESREALDKFMKLNVFILDLKKFQFATTEATRKILKKHTKRTALPVSSSMASLFTIQGSHSSDPSSSLVLASSAQGTSLSLLLIQAVAETLLPIVPHIDDYACVICTSIAFKPIRLHCGHLFCVRCLVKMQKSGKGNCPMCRAPTVLQADRTNVDWALLNFMRDWFPIESRQKLQQNEREAAEEQMRELGFKTNGPTCVCM